MVFVEFKTFKAAIGGLMPDEVCRESQQHLMETPEAGDTLKGTHGLLRKIRWKLPSTGKSGGVRIIYFWKQADDQIWLIYAYAKSDQEDLTPDQEKRLAALVQQELIDERKRF